MDWTYLGQLTTGYVALLLICACSIAAWRDAKRGPPWRRWSNFWREVCSIVGGVILLVVVSGMLAWLTSYMI